MAPLRILVCGGGCAGPALAFWLARAGHQITIVERFSALRATGAQIDLREQGIQIVKRMGLLDAVRAIRVQEPGVQMVDDNGNIFGTIMANTSGKGKQSVTSEYEIMRGDLVRLLYNETKDMEGVEYVFGKTVDDFEQDGESVLARFSDGSEDRFDMMVGADGQGSRVRRSLLSQGQDDPLYKLGVNMAYYFIPRDETDDAYRRTYHPGGGRMIFRRTHSPTESQVYLIIKTLDDSMNGLAKMNAQQQKDLWTAKFQDAGWQTPRFLEGMKTTENWYSQEVIQIKADSWHKGRVVLLGDAAHCPSPFSGMGTTGALVGAYVLAGEIAQKPDDLSEAFSGYETTMRPFIEEIQKINPTLLKMGMPQSRWGVWVLRTAAWLVCWSGLPALISRFGGEETGGWKVPEYPQLKSDK